MGEQQGPEYYDVLWGRLVRTIKDDSPWEVLWSAISERVMRSRSIQGVVDVGCGCGHLADLLHRKKAVREYVGVDFSEFAIDYCANLHLPSVFEFKVWDVLEQGLPMLDGCSGDEVAYVFCEILEHVDDDLSLLEAVPHGCEVMLTVPNFGDPAHVRQFENVTAVVERYARFFGGFDGDYVASRLPTENHFLLVGTRSEIPGQSVKPKPDPSGITLYMIVKDEELGVKRAIESCKDLVSDSVVVVDDNTTDDTWDEAERAGAEVYGYSWKGDFAAHRNNALRYVQTKWGLVLDGHEYLSGDLNKIRRAIHEHPDAGAFEIEVVMEDGKKHLDRHRLHRVEGAVWKNRRHNLLSVPGEVFHIHGVRIIHDRYGGQSEESRKARNEQRSRELVEGFKKDIRENPRDTRSMYYLAQQFRDMGEWEKAYYWYDRYNRTEGGNQWDEERFMANYNAGRAAIALGDYEMALWHGKQAVDRNELRAEGWALRGDAHYAMKQYVRAQRAYEKAGACDLPDGAKLPVDPTIYKGGWKVADQVAMCCWHLGNHERGAEVCLFILTLPDLPQRERGRINDNLHWHEKRMRAAK